MLQKEGIISKASVGSGSDNVWGIFGNYQNNMLRTKALVTYCATWFAFSLCKQEIQSARSRTCIRTTNQAARLSGVLSVTPTKSGSNKRGEKSYRNRTAKRPGKQIAGCVFLSKYNAAGDQVGSESVNTCYLEQPSNNRCIVGFAM